MRDLAVQNWRERDIPERTFPAEALPGPWGTTYQVNKLTTLSHLKHGDNGDDLLGAAHLSGGEEHLAQGGMDGQLGHVLAQRPRQLSPLVNSAQRVQHLNTQAFQMEF